MCFHWHFCTESPFCKGHDFRSKTSRMHVTAVLPRHVLLDVQTTVSSAFAQALQYQNNCAHEPDSWIVSAERATHAIKCTERLQLWDFREAGRWGSNNPRKGHGRLALDHCKDPLAWNRSTSIWFPHSHRSHWLYASDGILCFARAIWRGCVYHAWVGRILALLPLVLELTRNP